MNLKLEILHLRMLKAIVDSGSVTAAARQLGVTQSALSHRLRDAERRLDTSLFERKNRKLALTDTGKRLLFSAEIILNELENVEYQISTASSKNFESVRVGMKAYGSYHWLPHVINSFRATNPGVEIELVADVINDPVQALQDNVIDLAIVSHPANAGGLEAVKLFRDEMVAVLPARHPKAALEYLEVDDFSAETYITYETVPERGREYDLFFSHSRTRVDKIIRIGRTDAIIEMVSAGMGVTVLTHWVLTPYLASHPVSARPLTAERLFIDWHALTHKEKSSPFAHSVIEEISKHVRENMPAPGDHKKYDDYFSPPTH